MKTFIVLCVIFIVCFIAYTLFDIARYYLNENIDKRAKDAIAHHELVNHKELPIPIKWPERKEPDWSQPHLHPELRITLNSGWSTNGAAKPVERAVFTNATPLYLPETNPPGMGVVFLKSITYTNVIPTIKWQSESVYYTTNTVPDADKNKDLPAGSLFYFYKD